MQKISKFARAAVAGASVALSLGWASSASAVVVQWADLLTASTVGRTTTVTGSIIVGSETVDVTFVGDDLSFVQTNGGTYFYTQGSPQPYTSGEVENAPPTSDIIALSGGGLKTISFSQSVSNVYLALVSWNGNSGTFTQPITPISAGCGYWGCGSFSNVTPNSFDGSGELHGIVRFTGEFSSVSFTDRPEGWHGIQIGIAGLAPPPPGAVPEPATWAMMIMGLGGAGAMLRRRRDMRAISA